MDNLVLTLTNAIPLLVVTLVGGWLLNGRFSRLERKVDALPTREEFSALTQRADRLEARFESQFDSLETRFESQFDSLRSDIASLRSDITQIALAVGTRLRPQTG